ncbi:glycoside hydrolase family protein [Chryseobacterium zhengzhouense]|uniref:Lysozyme n=1 Tax=Chryseobacterium zhengzhouense TaxID=1636086 RepID=A0ABW2LYK5_9FLAO
MSKKGVSKISGNTSPTVGEATTYTITDWYPATPQNQRNAAGVTWELFKKRSNGRFTTTNIKKTGAGTFTFGEVAQKHTYRLEAYLFEPEGSGASTLEITPQPAAVPKIEKVELQYVDDSLGTEFSFTEKMRARAHCVNLAGKKLKFSLWEDDQTGEGHDAKNLLIETKEASVNASGVAVAEFTLTRALMQKAMQGETDPEKLEFYVTVEYFSHTKHATDNVDVNNPLHTPAPATRPQPKPQQPNSNPSGQAPVQNTPPRAQNSPAAAKPQSQKEEKGIVDRVTDWWNNLELWDYKEALGKITAQKTPTPQAGGGKTVSIVQDSSVENLTDAYFAKKEYTKLTGEADGNHVYTFGGRKANNKTSTADEKAKIAETILKKIEGELKNAKKYTTKETIIQVLTANEYGTDTENNKTVTIPVFKLGAEFKKIEKAPLDAKVYLVARAAGLNGKQATITIKEKDGLIKGSADAVLSILEITEEQMNMASSATEEVPGTEKQEFTGQFENGEVRIPVHLRPKSNDDLKNWVQKVSKGKEDGEYTYKFGGENKVTDESSKKTVAETILRYAKSGNENNVKIADGKNAYLDDIINALEIKDYQKNNTVTFSLYRKMPELLYLHVKAQGEKAHDKNFLQTEGAYFEIIKSKPIIFPFLVKPENDIAGIHKNYYWAAAQNTNQATFNSNRKGGRKHAGRDLYSKPYTEVVAICDGKVLDVSTSFADGTGAVTILHETNDGRKFIIRYGEVENNTVVVKAGDMVKQKDPIGKTGWLRTWYKGVVRGYEVYMLHFEYFTGAAGFDLNSSLSNSSNPPFSRRSDLGDGVAILQEGYRNTFEEDTGERVPPSTLRTSERGKDFIKDYEKFESNVYNDSEGYCTIGYGYLIAKNKCENITIPERFKNGITHETALQLFDEKLATFENAIRRDITVNLHQYEFDALASLLYNTGANFLNVGGRNGGETQIKIKINSGDYHGGADEFADVTNGGERGLVTRRNQEINMFKTNVYDSTH